MLTFIKIENNEIKNVWYNYSNYPRHTVDHTKNYYRGNGWELIVCDEFIYALKEKNYYKKEYIDITGTYRKEYLLKDGVEKIKITVAKPSYLDKCKKEKAGYIIEHMPHFAKSVENLEKPIYKKIFRDERHVVGKLPTTTLLMLGGDEVLYSPIYLQKFYESINEDKYSSLQDSIVGENAFILKAKIRIKSIENNF